jgi:hypothetical protein
MERLAPSFRERERFDLTPVYLDSSRAADPSSALTKAPSLMGSMKR